MIAIRLVKCKNRGFIAMEEKAESSFVLISKK